MGAYKVDDLEAASVPGREGRGVERVRLEEHAELGGEVVAPEELEAFRHVGQVGHGCLVMLPRSSSATNFCSGSKLERSDLSFPAICAIQKPTIPVRNGITSSFTFSFALSWDPTGISSP